MKPTETTTEFTCSGKIELGERDTWTAILSVIEEEVHDEVGDFRVLNYEVEVAGEADHIHYWKLEGETV